MQAPVKHIQSKQTLWLSAERTIYWEEEQSLIISDLHFGKTGHFRKSGIPIPQSVFKNDMQRLFEQVQHYQPRQLIIVGDMFHSKANKELDFFLKWRNDHPGLHIQLVKGNHDILQTEWYKQASVELIQRSVAIKEFHFVHDIEHADTLNKAQTSEIDDKEYETEQTRNPPTAQAGQKPETYLPGRQARNYLFSGHLHPGILIRGLAKQALRFPCFYFGEQYAILPAFGNFTGLALIEPNARENVYAIVENKIIQIQ